MSGWQSSFDDVGRFAAKWHARESRVLAHTRFAIYVVAVAAAFLCGMLGWMDGGKGLLGGVILIFALGLLPLAYARAYFQAHAQGLAVRPALPWKLVIEPGFLVIDDSQTVVRLPLTSLSTVTHVRDESTLGLPHVDDALLIPGPAGLPPLKLPASSEGFAAVVTQLELSGLLRVQRFESKVELGLTRQWLWAQAKAAGGALMGGATWLVRAIQSRGMANEGSTQS